MEGFGGVFFAVWTVCILWLLVNVLMSAAHSVPAIEIIENHPSGTFFFEKPRFGALSGYADT
jgi:hypothetical protein